MAASGNMGGAAAMCGIIGRLSTAAVANEIRTGNLLGVEVVKRISQRLISEIVATLETLNLPNFAETCDELGERFIRAIEEERVAATRNIHRPQESITALPGPQVQGRCPPAVLGAISSNQEERMPATMKIDQARSQDSVKNDITAQRQKPR